MKKKIKIPKVTEEDLRTKREFVVTFNKSKIPFNSRPRLKIKQKKDEEVNKQKYNFEIDVDSSLSVMDIIGQKSHLNRICCVLPDNVNEYIDNYLTKDYPNHLYIILFKNKGCKVGISSSIKRRLSDYRKPWCLEIDKIFLIGTNINVESIELKLKRSFKKNIVNKHSSEFITNTTFKSVCYRLFHIFCKEIKAVDSINVSTINVQPTFTKKHTVQYQKGKPFNAKTDKWL